MIPPFLLTGTFTLMAVLCLILVLGFRLGRGPTDYALYFVFLGGLSIALEVAIRLLVGA